MNQLTVRGFDDELSDRLRGLARREGISLNQAALRLLRKGAGLTDGGGGRGKVRSSLDDLFGSWTAEEADAARRGDRGLRGDRRRDVAVRVLLDTNAYSQFARGRAEVARGRMGG